MKSHTRQAAAVLLVVSALAVVLEIARRHESLPEGLQGRYFASVDWSAPLVHAGVDRRPSTESLAAAWNGAPPGIFSATWEGSFMALDAGIYQFATASDDGSWLYVDGQLVVENGGNHGLRIVSGSTRLARGVHTIFVRYFQDGGAFSFDLLWSRGGAPLAPIPEWALTSKEPSFPRFLASVGLRRAPTIVAWIWPAALLLTVAAAAWSRVATSGAALLANPWGRALAVVVAGSLALNVTGIGWGLPGRTWAGDELTPLDLMSLLQLHFSNGWWSRWPPLQYYVLTAAFSPWLLLAKFSALDVLGDPWSSRLIVIARLISIAAGAGTLISVYLCGARAFSKRAGLAAAAAFALVVPFVYYSKTANLDGPWLFWCTLSFLFYLRLLDTLTLEDAALFAASATLAICTKDQTYALYIATPFVLVYELWRRNRQVGVERPLLRAVADVRLAVAAIVATLIFAVCHNLLFNFPGFLHHVRYITGGGSENYRMFDETAAGRRQLLALTGKVDYLSLGWPLLVASVIGGAIAMARSRTRRVAVSLLFICVSYYLGFIDVVLYNYDRFMLPVFVVQALFAGVAIDWFLGQRIPVARWRVAAVGVVFVYGLLYAGTVDVLMLRDSRYGAERWLRAHVGANDLVATVFPFANLPHVDGFQAVDIGTVEQLQGEAPAFYVLNADYGRFVPPDSPTRPLIDGLQQGTLGYTLVYEYRAAGPWPWLPGGHPDLVGPRLEPQVSSILRDINPAIQIYQRNPVPQ